MKNYKCKLFSPQNDPSKTNNLQQTPKIKQQSIKQVALFMTQIFYLCSLYREITKHFQCS